jgi:membrane protease YdiL (CAAX protease family)
MRHAPCVNIQRQILIETKGANAMQGESNAQKGVTIKTLVPFLAIVFGFSWSIIALLIFFTDQVVAIFGEISSSNPLFILAVYGPSLAGVFLVWRHYGIKGLGSFFRRLTLWRISRWWWLFLILGIPVIAYLGAAVKGSIDDPFPFSPWYQMFPAWLLALFLGPIGEEFGWRGLALPLLQRKFAPFWAGLILGIIWGFWHTPAFLLSGTPFGAWAFGPWFVGVVSVSLILTPLFNHARGSIPIAILFHLLAMNPMFPDAQPWDYPFWVIAAVIIVWLNRRTMFQRGAGVTEVLFPGDSAA